MKTRIIIDSYENIYVVDSGSAAIGSGILAERALELANSGIDAREIAEALNKEKEKIVIIALLDTLEYFKKGGRISKTVAFAGAVLNYTAIGSVIGTHAGPGAIAAAFFKN